MQQWLKKKLDEFHSSQKMAGQKKKEEKDICTVIWGVKYMPTAEQLEYVKSEVILKE